MEPTGFWICTPSATCQLRLPSAPVLCLLVRVLRISEVSRGFGNGERGIFVL
ncbi:hypothetical protein LEMLEM_LOCUS7470, partial [Lemmus lemmus]